MSTPKKEWDPDGHFRKFREETVEMGESNIKRELIACFKDKERKRLYIIYLLCPKGTISWVSLEELEKIQDHDGKSCLICPGTIRITWRKKEHPDLYLICDSCRALYKIIEDQLCLLDRA